MNIRENEDYFVIDMPGHLSPDVIDQTEKEFSDFIKDKKGKQFVLDVEKLFHIRSADIRYIAFLHRHISAHEGKFAIVNAKEDLEQTLKTVSLDRSIPIYRSIIDFEIEKDSA